MLISSELINYQQWLEIVFSPSQEFQSHKNMFSVGYFNKAMVINTINVRRINFQNIEKLRRLVIQLLRNPCGRIILNIQGIKFIDSYAFEILDNMHQLATRQNVQIEFTNVDEEVLELFELVSNAQIYRVLDQVQLQDETALHETIIV